MIIKRYQNNDPELISKIGFLLGSDEWWLEHKQGLRRRCGKVFYLLLFDDTLVSMCSIYKNIIGDCHSIEHYRKRGYMMYLLNRVVSKKCYGGTSNPSMERIFKKIGMKYKLNRGVYKYYEFKD